MAQVDVTELLSDPDFVDPCTLVHRQAVVDILGQNQLTERQVPTIGSIQPATGKQIDRLPEALRVKDVRTFWIKGTIVSDGKCAYPDVIIFKNQRYAVEMVFDWTNFGEGWCEGLCIRERPSL